MEGDDAQVWLGGGIQSRMGRFGRICFGTPYELSG